MNNLLSFIDIHFFHTSIFLINQYAYTSVKMSSACLQAYRWTDSSSSVSFMDVMMLFSCSSNFMAAQKPDPHSSYMSVPVRIPKSSDFNPLCTRVHIPYSPTGRRAVIILTLTCTWTPFVQLDRSKAFPFYFCVSITILDRNRNEFLFSRGDDTTVSLRCLLLLLLLLLLRIAF